MVECIEKMMEGPKIQITSERREDVLFLKQQLHQVLLVGNTFIIVKFPIDFNPFRNEIQRSNREVHGFIINIFTQKPKKFGDRT